MTESVILIDEQALESFKDVEGCSSEGWYFWDETGTHLFGPFSSSDRAEIALNVYCVSCI